MKYGWQSLGRLRGLRLLLSGQPLLQLAVHLGRLVRIRVRVVGLGLGVGLRLGLGVGLRLGLGVGLGRGAGLGFKPLALQKLRPLPRRRRKCATMGLLHLVGVRG